MYNREFCDIYDKYGWDYFSITMGEAILKYFETKNKNINNHLDLACGVGTLCNYFYDHDIKTTGTDISEDMIEICKTKNKKINYFVADMTNYISNEKYDLITITCDAVNHILEEEKVKRLFSNAYEMLNDDGYLIFDIIDKNKICLNTEIVSNRDNDTKVHYYITEKDSLVNTNVKVVQNDKLIHVEDIVEKLYDIEFIKQTLINFNFKLEKIDNKISDEKQRVEDKIYIICKK